jgi:uncharacterized membrane protein YeaQ/YmgE (transglycosylase-associated protein family)
VFFHGLGIHRLADSGHNRRLGCGHLTRGQGFGIIGNIVVGVIGAVIGGFIFGLVGLSSTGFIGSLVTAIIGAVVLLYIASWVTNVDLVRPI